MQTITREVRLFVPIVIASATAVVVLLADQVPWDDWPRLLLFLGLMIFAFSVRIPDPRGGSLTPSIVLSYLAVYVFNPPTAVLVVGVGRTIAYSLSRGWIPWRAIFNGCQIALSVAAGAYVFRLLGGEPGKIELASTYLALAAAPLAHQVANNFFVAYGLSRWRGTPFLSTWFSNTRDLFWPNLLSIPTAILLAILYSEVHYAVVLVYLALFPLQRLAIGLYVKRRQLYAQIVDGLVVATDVNFPLGRGHAKRVAELAVSIAREMRLSETAVESVQFAALMHDVGMIGKDELLDRPVLAPEDAEGLRDHVLIGAQVAKELPRREIATMILCHHERFDGAGYPRGLQGEAIPLGARIIALAEVVDSMASGIHPFVGTAPLDAITLSVEREKGAAFDPEVADAFIRLVEKGLFSVSDVGLGDQFAQEAPRLGETPVR